MSETWNQFVSFSELEMSTGGPDPQVEIAANMAPDNPPWFAGCFVVPYTLGAGVAIYQHFPTTNLNGIENFLETHWAGIPIRRERRAVWRADKLAICLRSYALWCDNMLPKLETATYDQVYTSIRHSVKFFGRYAAMKLIETLYLASVIEASQVDIRPDGAKYPRRTLADLMNEFSILEGNKPAQLLEVNRIATIAREESIAMGLDDPSWFQFETLLCNYRQALNGKYPGRSHDRELAHFKKTEAYWGSQLDTTRFYMLRQTLFPNECLGEIQGWNGARKDLEFVWKEYGYFWCDTKYDYNKTALAHPKVRDAAL
jgi:hypothetical protein